MKTFVYGDSFSNHEMCECTQDQMWYSGFVEGELIDRTRGGASTDEAFLLMHHDAICDPDARFLFGTGAMYSRLTKYTDGLYENETVREHHTIDDCLGFFGTHRFDQDYNEDAVKIMHPDIFHHTLVWTRYLTQIILTASLLPSTSLWLVVHLHCDRNEWQSPHHPMVKPLLQRISGIPNYIGHEHSCFNLCKDNDVRAVDWEKYGESGHQGPAGQRLFGDYIKQIVHDRGLCN